MVTASRSELPHIAPSDQIDSHSGPPPCSPLYLPSLIAVTLPQAIEQSEQPSLRTRLRARSVSPLILSASGRYASCAFRTGIEPVEFMMFTRTAVPYRGSPPLATGFCARISLVVRTASANLSWSATVTPRFPRTTIPLRFLLPTTCLLYTSDAADDLLCVDLGGRR